MSQNTDPNINQNLETSDALGSPNETVNSSASDIPSFDESKSEILNFFDHDYISNLGADSENSADDKEDLSDLPTFLEEESEKKDEPGKKDESANVDETQDNSQKDDEESAEKTEEEKNEDAEISAESQNSDKSSETDKPDALTDEEKKSIPKSKWDDYRRAKIYARTEAKFLDPNEKMGDFLGHLEQKSPARLKELRQEVLLSSVTTLDESGKRSVDGNKLLSALYSEIGAEDYTGVVTSIVDNYAEHAVEMLKEKGYTLVKQGESSQSNPEAPQIDNEQLNSILKEAELYMDDDKVELLRSVLTQKAATEVTQADEKSPAEIAAQSAEENSDDEAESSKTDVQEQTPDLPPEVIQNWNNAVNESLPIVDLHLNNLLDTTYGLQVTEIERTNVPELADLKEEKKELIFYGTRDGKLPAFDIGLIQRFREDESFKQSFDRFKYFAEKGEISNAQNAIREIIPFAETYLNERLNHDQIKRKDAAIKRIADSVNGREHNNVHLSGGTGISSGGNGGGGNSESNSFLNPETL